MTLSFYIKRDVLQMLKLLSKVEPLCFGRIFNVNDYFSALLVEEIIRYPIHAIYMHERVPD
jgi:hypothetical protein